MEAEVGVLKDKETRVMQSQAKVCYNHQNLEEPPEGLKPCQHLDLGLLTSRPMRKFISVV